LSPAAFEATLNIFCQFDELDGGLFDELDGGISENRFISPSYRTNISATVFAVLHFKTITRLVDGSGKSL
jgi:hypothetical protein